MIRRSSNENKTYEPDTNHLHHLIYRKLKYYLKFKNNLSLHFLSSLLINFYNLICFLISTKYIYNSKILVFLIILNIFIYVSTYNLLKNNFLKFSFDGIKT